MKGSFHRMDTLHQSDSIDNPTKTCTGPCGLTLPATPEYWSPSKTGKYGLRSICKPCRRILRKNPPEKPTPPPDGYKQCTDTCGCMLPATSEYFSAGRSQCKKCRCDKSKERYQDNRDVLKDKSREYYHKHRDIVIIKHRAWHHSNKEMANQRSREWHHSHKEEAREHARFYRRTHRDRFSAYQRWYYQRYRLSAHGSAMLHMNRVKQRARRYSAPGRHTAAQLQDQYRRQKGRCYWCKDRLGKERSSWHADHVIPLSRGGSNDISNIVCSCPTCNLKRKDRLPHEVPELGRVV